MHAGILERIGVGWKGGGGLVQFGVIPLSLHFSLQVLDTLNLCATCLEISTT